MKRSSIIKMSPLWIRRALTSGALALLATYAIAQPMKSAQEVVLPSGITLLDWVGLQPSTAATPRLDVGAEAAALIKRYGPYRELLDIVWRSSLDDAYLSENINSSNAATKLALVTDARQKLGDWPHLLLAHARAHALSGNSSAALSDLKKWLVVSPANDAGRSEIVSVVVAGDKDLRALQQWTETPPAALAVARKLPIPSRLQPYEAAMMPAKSCMGRPRLAADFELITAGSWSSKGLEGQEFRQQTRNKVVDVGLLSSKSEDRGSLDGIREQDVVTSVFGSWTLLKTALSDGSELHHSALARDIKCSRPLLPLSKGTGGSWSSVTEAAMYWRNYPAGTSTQQTVGNRVEYEVVSDAMSAAEALKKYPVLRLEGKSIERWRVYELKVLVITEYKRIEPIEQREKYKDSKIELRALFLDGPNIFIYPEQWDAYLQPGWAISLKESE